MSEMIFYREFMRYLRTGRMAPDFLGLDGAPGNNIQHYASRQKFANWCAKKFGVGDLRNRVSISTYDLCKRLGQVVAIREGDEDTIMTTCGIMVLESGIRNEGFGRDRHGSSTAIGPMQTKWAAVMDAGLPFEAYLDILTDRDALIGVDAGVGYYMRMSRGRDLMDGVARYNNPSTRAATNLDYCKAFERAIGSSRFGDAHDIAMGAYERQMDVLRSAVSAEG